MTNDKEKKEVFRKNLNRCIELSGKTNAEIAKALEIDPSSVSWWKTGRSTPTVERIEQLANLFGCSVSDLVSSDTVPADYILSGDEKLLIECYRKSDSATKDMMKRLVAYVENFNEKP